MGLMVWYVHILDGSSFADHYVGSVIAPFNYYLLLLGAILIGFSFICAIIVSILDSIGTKQLGVYDDIKAQSKRMVRLQ